jgi:hypothetical protein
MNCTNRNDSVATFCRSVTALKSDMTTFHSRNSSALKGKDFVSHYVQLRIFGKRDMSGTEFLNASFVITSSRADHKSHAIIIVMN